MKVQFQIFWYPMLALMLLPIYHYRLGVVIVVYHYSFKEVGFGLTIFSYCSFSSSVGSDILYSSHHFSRAIIAYWLPNKKCGVFAF